MNSFSLLAKISVRNGAIAGVLGTGVLIALYYFNRHPLMISPFFDYRIILYGIFIFFGLKEYRDFYQQGILYFWQGLFGSAVVVLTASLVASIGLLIFVRIEPEFVSSYVHLMTQYLKSFSEEDIQVIGKSAFDSNLNALSSTNSWHLVITYFSQSLIISFFISIILSVILRRTPKI